MKIIHEAEFEAVTKQNKLVLVDFFATWCGPCKMLGPVLEELAGDFGDQIEIVKIDVDQDGDLAMRFGIMPVPTMQLYKNGQLVETLQGFQPKPQLANVFQKYI